MHFEEFSEGDTFFHKLDPRVKILTLLPYISLLAVLDGLKLPILAFIISFAMALLLIFFSKERSLYIKKLFKRVLVINFFVFFLWIFIPFSYPGKELFSLGSLKATKEGYFYVLSITFKANAIYLATISLLGTSNIFSLVRALYYFKFPDKLIYLFFFFYRYLTVLHEEYTSMRNAMLIRAFKAKTNLHTYRTYAYLIGMLLVRSYERSQRIYQAMLCRGFKGKFHVLNHFELRKRDIIFCIFMAMLTCTLGYFSWFK